MKFLSNLLSAFISQMIALFVLVVLLSIGLVSLIGSLSDMDQDIAVSLGGRKATSYKDPVAIKEMKNKILWVDLSEVVDAPNPELNTPMQNLLDGFFDGDQGGGISLYHLCESLDQAAKDETVSAIYIDLDKGNTLGLSQINTLHRSLNRFKKSGKKIYCYAEGYSQSDYLTASVSDSIFMHPMGSVELKGFAMQSFHLKDFLSKYRIDVSVWQQGKYKSAVEAFTTSKSPSPAKAIASRELLHDLWNSFVPQLMQRTKSSKEELIEMVSERKALLSQSALTLHVLDGLCPRDQLLQRFEKQKLSKIYISEYLYSKRTDTPSNSDKAIALVYLSGALNNIDERDDYDNNINRGVLEMLEEIEKDEDLSGVVLRVNSPGGSALLSDLIYDRIERIKKTKTVVVSMGNYAASGGYYISANAHKIFTEPQTITGSIGVIGLMLSFGKTLEGIDINTSLIQTHKNSYYLGSLTKPSPYTHQQIQEQVKDVYDRFLEKVSTGRNLSIDYVHKIAQGRVWSGKRAVELKLADEIGGIKEAIDFISQKGNFKNPTVVEYPKNRSFSFKDIKKGLLKMNSGGMSLVSTLESRLGIFGEQKHFHHLLTPKKYSIKDNAIQAILPFQFTIY